METERSPQQNSPLFFPPLYTDATVIPSDDTKTICSLSTNTSSDHSPSSGSAYLWKDVHTISMPESSTPPQTSTTAPSSTWSSSTRSAFLCGSSVPLTNPNSNTSSPTKDSSVFNISWGGGQDQPPKELVPDDEVQLPTVPSKPLPKPRGIRRLPEPEPSEDGTLDEDTLKRRKNTSAARKSRLKKLMHIEHLEHRIQQFQTENSQLVLNNAVLESEKKSLLAKEQEYKKRIKYLEDIVRMSCSSVLDQPSDYSPN